MVWNIKIGKQIGVSKCLCCNHNEISQQEFNCGHIISIKDGGLDILENLLPICSSCNGSMGSTNLVDFKNTYFPCNI